MNVQQQASLLPQSTFEESQNLRLDCGRTTRLDRNKAQPCNLLNQALGYAEGQWPVFPVWPRAKRPLTRHGFRDAVTDAATIRRWWKRWPNANIGLAVPAGFLVLDLDSPDSLHRLKAQDLTLPSTATAKTGRGFHFWYAVDHPIKNSAGIFPGVDIRAAGGYVIVPPSVHACGARYRWEVPLERTSISECPDWLIEELRQATTPARGRSAGDWWQTIAEPVEKGRRNQTLARVAGLLFRKLPAQMAAELAACWAQAKLSPPLSDREVMRTIESIAGRELRRRTGQR